MNNNTYYKLGLAAFFSSQILGAELMYQNLDDSGVSLSQKDISVYKKINIKNPGINFF